MTNDRVALKLAEVSYSSPYIMQQLCLDLVRWEHGIVETVSTDLEYVISEPANMAGFLQESAERARWGILPKLLAGPPRTTRVVQRLRDGNIETDIYGAVLTALKNLTPPLSHSEFKVYQEVSRICSTNVQSPQVTNALQGMHKIADKERGDSDPVLRRRDGQIFIEDSGFAFYLNHGLWSPEKKST